MNAEERAIVEAVIEAWDHVWKTQRYEECAIDAFREAGGVEPLRKLLCEHEWSPEILLSAPARRRCKLCNWVEFIPE